MFGSLLLLLLLLLPSLLLLFLLVLLLLLLWLLSWLLLFLLVLLVSATFVGKIAACLKIEMKNSYLPSVKIKGVSIINRMKHS